MLDIVSRWNCYFSEGISSMTLPLATQVKKEIVACVTKHPSDYPAYNNGEDTMCMACVTAFATEIGRAHV